MPGLYNEHVMEIFQNPKNVGLLRNANGVGVSEDVKGGEIVKVYIKVENNVITDSKFKTFGGVTAIVASSIATELIKERTLEDALLLSQDDILQIIGKLTEDKIKSISLVVNAVKLAVEDYKEKLEKEAKRLEKLNQAK